MIRQDSCEGDALNVISAITNNTAGCAHIHFVYDHLLSMLPLFEDIKASFLRSRGNIVAHVVSRWEANFTCEKVCMPPFPVCLLSLAELNLS